MKLSLLAAVAALVVLAAAYPAQADMGRSKAPKGIYGVGGGGGSGIYGVRQRNSARIYGGGSSSRRLFTGRTNEAQIYGVRKNYQNLAGFIGKNFFSSGAKRFF